MAAMDYRMVFGQLGPKDAARRPVDGRLKPCGWSVSGVVTDAPFASTISGKGPGNTLEVVQKWDDPKIIFFFVNHNIHHRDVPETSLLAQLILFFVVDHVQL